MVGARSVLGYLSGLGPFANCGEMAAAWLAGRAVKAIVGNEEELMPGDLAAYGEIAEGTTCFCIVVAPGRVAIVPEGGGAPRIAYVSTLRSTGARFSGAVRLGVTP